MIFVVVSLFVVSAVKFLALFDRPALKHGSGPGLIIYYKTVHLLVCFCFDLTFTCKSSAGHVALLLVMGLLCYGFCRKVASLMIYFFVKIAAL